MGGIVAVTIRFSEGEEWRGSCWTNILPEGLFDWPFYVPDKSEGHTRTWLDKLLSNRKEDPELEKIWGEWNKLAPIEYGIIVIDYKKNGFLSLNGYTNPGTVYTSAINTGALIKFIELNKRKLTYDVRDTSKSLVAGPTVSRRAINRLTIKCQRAIAYNGEWEMDGVVRGGAARRGDPPPRPDVPYMRASIRLPFKDARLLCDWEYKKAMRWIKSRFSLSVPEQRKWNRTIKEYEQDAV